MAEHIVGTTAEIEPGERRIVEVNGIEICIFNINGEYHGVLNWCPHQGGPLCKGDLGGAVRATFDRKTLETEVIWDDEESVIACPWHGWEFDVETGSCFSRENSAVPIYEVQNRNGEIVLIT